MRSFTRAVSAIVFGLALALSTSISASALGTFPDVPVPTVGMCSWRVNIPVDQMVDHLRGPLPLNYGATCPRPNLEDKVLYLYFSDTYTTPDGNFVHGFVSDRMYFSDVRFGIIDFLAFDGRHEVILREVVARTRCRNGKVVHYTTNESVGRQIFRFLSQRPGSVTIH